MIAEKVPKCFLILCVIARLENVKGERALSEKENLFFTTDIRIVKCHAIHLEVNIK